MIAGDVFADRFEVERPVASGGMGQVYRARDRQGGEWVALKVLFEGVGEASARLSREAATLSEIHHAGIVGYRAHGTTRSGVLYLAMEWLEGVTLSQRIASGALSVPEAVAVVRRIAAALGALHRRGIVHRDVKPSNVMLAGAELSAATIIDLGLVRHTAGERVMARPDVVVGTPEYMAPEQVRSPEGVDARADVFSLGCVLFRCLAGRGAFAGDDLSVLVKVLLEDPPRLDELRADVPPELAQLCARMLSKSPEERPRDGDAVVAALDALGAPPSSDRDARLPHAPRPPPRELTPLERRVTCLVLTRDRAGGTDETRSTEQDDARREALRALVERHHGRIELLVDRSLLAVHTGTGPASDLAAEAARCALALSAMLADVPIVVATGRTELARPLGGHPRSSGTLPVGDLIDRAAGLFAAFPPMVPGSAPAIVLDEVTAGLLGARFDVAASAGSFVLHGEQEALGATRTLLGKETSCVGREREVAQLDDVIAHSEDGAFAVLITAAAGTGKSRLAREVLRRLRARPDPVAIWIGAGDPVSAGSPFALLGQALRGTADLREGDPPAVARDKIRARVGPRLGEEQERVTEFLGELCHIPFPDEGRLELGAARRDPVLMGDQMRRAFEDFVRAECALRPVLLVLEDLQWGDLPTVRFVDAALRNLCDERLVILALARPEVHQLFPRLWAGRRVREIRLGPLNRRAGARLAREVLGDAVSDEVVEGLSDQAQGNAFYLEELIRAVAEGRSALPETVLAMVHARLDALDPEARRVLRAASVFGQRFWRGGVSTLLGGADVERWLSALLADEVISAAPEARFPGEAEYRFRHALVREAAYGMLTEDDRPVGHRLAGEWLERAGERDALVLAEHFERAGVGARAAPWFRRAAEQAFEANDLDAAIARAGRAMVAARDDTTLPESWFGDLHLLQAEAHRWRGEQGEVRSAGLEAMRRLSPGSDRWCAATSAVAAVSVKLRDLALLDDVTGALLALGSADPSASTAIALADVARANYYAGRHEQAAALLGRSEESAAHLGEDLVVTAHVAWARALSALSGHDESGLLDHTARSRAAFEGAGDLRAACMLAGNEADSHLRLGNFDRARELLDAALITAERIGLPALCTSLETNRSLALAHLGRFDEARADAGRAIAAGEAQGDRRGVAYARVYLAMIQALAGDLASASVEARVVADEPSTPASLRAFALAILARAELSGGRPASALATAREAMAILASLGPVEEGEAPIRLIHAEALEAAGDGDAARVALGEARARLLARADRIHDPAHRKSFLERIPENARTLLLSFGPVGDHG